MSQLVTTVAIFAAVIYLQGFRVDIPVKSSKQRGPYGVFPIKLFYTSNLPIMLQSALTSNIFIISQMLFKKFPTNVLVRLLGVWDGREGMQQLFPVSGIAYYMQPPSTPRRHWLTPSRPSSTLPLFWAYVPSSLPPGLRFPALLPRCGQAVQGAGSGDCWPTRDFCLQGAQANHPHRCSFWRSHHWRSVSRLRPARSPQLRNRYPHGRDHNLRLLRDGRQGGLR